MRPLRRSLPGGLYEFTTRVANGQLLAAPTQEVHDIILGVIGHAMRAHNVELHAFVFLSNHYHLLMSVPDSTTMSNFMCLLNSNISRELNIINDRDSSMWSRRFRSIPITADRASQLFRLRYILAHGVKENLVAKVSDWPGASSLRWLRDGKAIFGRWIRRTELFYARRRKNFVEDIDAFTTIYRIEMTVLPCWRDTPRRKWRREVRKLIGEIEAEAEQERRVHGRPPLGAAAARAQDPYTRVRSKRSRAPSVLSVDPVARKALHVELRARAEAWREAAEVAMTVLASDAGEGKQRLPAMYWRSLAA
jgi:REP element-mobilizing transposase RayT